jgi:putative FmdB family regulatory protein
MPTYQYRCTTCGHDLEAVQKFTDTALTECPSCGGSLRKVFNAVGVVFKGSGFYRTDSRNGGTNGNGSGSPDKVGAGEKSKSDGESKPGSAAPVAPKAKGKANGSPPAGRQPVGSGASSTGSSSST